MKYTLLGRKAFEIYTLTISQGTPPTASVSDTAGNPLPIGRLEICLDNQSGFHRCNFTVDTDQIECSVISAVEDCPGDDVNVDVIAATTVIHTDNPSSVVVLTGDTGDAGPGDST